MITSGLEVDFESEIIEVGGAVVFRDRYVDSICDSPFRNFVLVQVINIVRVDIWRPLWIFSVMLMRIELRLL